MGMLVNVLAIQASPCDTQSACVHWQMTCRSPVEDWAVVDDWTPCAIGAAPSAFDSNRSLPMSHLLHTEAACEKDNGLHLDARSQAQSAGNATKENGAAHAIKQQDPVSLLEVNSQRLRMLCSNTDKRMYSNVWECFTEDIAVDSADEQAKQTLTGLPLIGGAVRVL